MTSTPDAPDPAEELRKRIENSAPEDGRRHVDTAVLHRSEDVCRTATLWFFPEGGDDGKLILVANSWTPQPDHSGFDLRPGAPEPRAEQDASLSAVIRKVQTAEADTGQSAQPAGAPAEAPNAPGILAAHGAGQVLPDVIQAAKQRDVITPLSEVARDPAAKENEFQRILEESWWMFGGRFAGKTKRRSPAVMTQLDVPLIRTDGALHGVEPKRACIRDLSVPYRKFFVVGPR